MLSRRLRTLTTRAAITMIAAGSAVALPLAYSSVAQAQTNCSPPAAPVTPAAPPTLAAPTTAAAPATTAVASATTTVAPATTVAKPAPTIDGIVVLEAGVSFDEPTTTAAPTTVATTVADTVAAARILARTPSMFVQARRVAFQTPACGASGPVANAEAADAGESTTLAFTGAKHNDRKAVGGASLLIAGAVLLAGTRSNRRGERNR